jgi:hypothetical protein
MGSYQKMLARVYDYGERVDQFFAAVGEDGWCYDGDVL